MSQSTAKLLLKLFYSISYLKMNEEQIVVLSYSRCVIVRLERNISPPLDDPSIILTLDKVFTFGM